MLYTKKGGQWKKLQTSVQQGLSVVGVVPRNHWGKYNGLWRRGTDEEIVISYNPTVLTVYPDQKIRDLVESISDPVKIRVEVGANAIIGGTPSRVARSIALDMVGDWHVDTKFHVDVYGGIIGSAGMAEIPGSLVLPNGKPKYTLESLRALGAAGANATTYGDHIDRVTIAPYTYYLQQGPITLYETLVAPAPPPP